MCAFASSASSGAVAGAAMLERLIKEGVMPRGARYSDMEIAAFLVGSASFMTSEELLTLTDAMSTAGTRLKWSPRKLWQPDKPFAGLLR